MCGVLVAWWKSSSNESSYFNSTALLDIRLFIRECERNLPHSLFGQNMATSSCILDSMCTTEMNIQHWCAKKKKKNSILAHKKSQHIRWNVLPLKHFFTNIVTASKVCALSKIFAKRAFSLEMYKRRVS